MWSQTRAQPLPTSQDSVGIGPRVQENPHPTSLAPRSLRNHLPLRKYHHPWDNSEVVSKTQLIRQKPPLRSRDTSVLGTQAQTSIHRTAATLSAPFAPGVSWVATALRMSTRAQAHCHAGPVWAKESHKSFHQPDLKSALCPGTNPPSPEQTRPPGNASDEATPLLGRDCQTFQGKKKRYTSHVTQYTHAHI